MTTLPQPTRGASGYTGFQATIRAVATGPRGSRDLTFQEARDAASALMDGVVSPIQAGAFLIGLRVKGEAPQEIAGFTQALRDRAPRLAAETDLPIVISGAPYCGFAASPSLSLAAAAVSAAAGVAVVMSCGRRIAPKNGVTAAEVLAELGGSGEPTVSESGAMLARSGMSIIHAGQALPGWNELAEIRDEVGLRGPFHSAEKLIDWFGAKRFVVGHTHGGYGDKLLTALRDLGAQQAIAVKGIEGSDVVRPGRPKAVSLNGPIEIPERLGLTLRGDADAAVSASLTRAVLAGDERGAAYESVVYSGAVRLIAGGVARDVKDALRRARAAVDEGRALAALEALIG
jgi:anthranilate phosphoribosyltransferase